MPNAYIVEAVRTAGAKKKGRLREWHPIGLGAAVCDELVKRTGIDGAMIDDVIVGCVSQVGAQSGNIGRNMVLASKYIPESVPGTSVDRQCGSSQQAIHFAYVYLSLYTLFVRALTHHISFQGTGSHVRSTRCCDRSWSGTHDIRTDRCKCCGRIQVWTRTSL